MEFAVTVLLADRKAVPETLSSDLFRAVFLRLERGVG